MHIATRPQLLRHSCSGISSILQVCLVKSEQESQGWASEGRRLFEAVTKGVRQRAFFPHWILSTILIDFPPPHLGHHANHREAANRSMA